MVERADRKKAAAAVAKERAAEKKRLRSAALRTRDILTVRQRREYSDKIIKNLTGLPCYQNADALLTYISFRSEVDTFSLLERAFADGKAVFAPKVLGKEMAFYQISSPKDLTEGYRGILEPSRGLLFDEWMDDRLGQKEPRSEKRTEGKGTPKEGLGVPSVLVCLPGAAFDRARHRIGYGGGFYDRFLGKLSEREEKTAGKVRPQVKITTAALAFGCQIFEEIPWEAHDICPEHIITETEMI